MKTKLNIPAEELKPFAKDHSEFTNACLDIIRQGRLPKGSAQQRLFEVMAEKHGFVKLLGIYVRRDKIDAFKKIILKSQNATRDNDNCL